MIKAITTTYNGYRFRSRLEARYAIFFNALGVRYEYEMEGFELDGALYLPDFWLPSMNLWVEIKPTVPKYGSTEWDLARSLADTHSPVIVASGTPGNENLTLFCRDTTDGGGGESTWEDSFWGIRNGDLICAVPNSGGHDLCDTNWNSIDWVICTDVYPNLPRFLKCFDRPEHAYAAARSARFEHDERLTMATIH